MLCRRNIPHVYSASFFLLLVTVSSCTWLNVAMRMVPLAAVAPASDAVSKPMTAWDRLERRGFSAAPSTWWKNRARSLLLVALPRRAVERHQGIVDPAKQDCQHARRSSGLASYSSLFCVRERVLHGVAGIVVCHAADAYNVGDEGQAEEEGEVW